MDIPLMASRHLYLDCYSTGENTFVLAVKD